MNATDKAEALRLLLDRIGSRFGPFKNPDDFALIDRDEYEQLRSLLSAQEAEPSAEHWRQAFDEVKCSVYDRDWKKIEQRARELARQGVGNG